MSIWCFNLHVRTDMLELVLSKQRMNTVNSRDLGQCNLGYKCVCMHTHASVCGGRQANKDIHFIFKSLRRGLMLLNMQSMFIYCPLFIFLKKESFSHKQIYQ